MKVRNHRKREWFLYPPKDSNIKGRGFKYKSDLMKFIEKNFLDCVNGTVGLFEQTFNSSSTIRQYFIWYNEKKYRDGASFKPELRQLDFRGSKYMHKPRPISKGDKRYFAFSDKVYRLMTRISNQGYATQKDAEKLVNLFYKRGFEDFEPDKEGWEQINYSIERGIDFCHWSDRCNFFRAKTIIEYFKRENLI